MQLSQHGLEFIKDQEGFKSEAYQDSVGVWTIGYGTIKINGSPVQQGMTCTESQASDWLLADLAWAQTAVNQLVKVTLSQGQYDALVSFVYNEGETNFARSTLLKLLNSGNYSAAAEEFKKWVYAGGRIIPGLVSRRAREESLYEE